ncbi:MAG: hypothetical protein JNM68_12820 [Dinghuibacter sp.]|nr:hypothetical protein [Dinghuibacter sp.]
MKTAVKTTRRKTWAQKRDIEKMPEVKPADIDFSDIKAGEKMLVPTPALVDAYIRQIPKGHFVPLATLRNDLAMEYHAQKTCPVTSGIFLRIVSEAAYEEYQLGKPLSKITPFWRAVAPNSPTAAKLTFGKALLLAQQKKEHIVFN